MANYTVLLSARAEKQLDKLSDTIAGPIIDAIAKLSIIHAQSVVKN